MQNLLFLSHRIPFPPDKGDKIRSYHILRHLSERFRVHLGCFFDDANDEWHVASLRALCASMHCLPLERSRKVMRALKGIATGRSMSEACYQDGRMRAWIKATLAANDIDSIFVFCSSMFPYVTGWPNLRVVIDIVDVDSEKWGAYAHSARWPLNLLYRLEQRRVLSLERRAVKECATSLFVSRAEADTFSRLAPALSSRVRSLENGVDIDRFDPAHRYASPYGADIVPIVFTGTMNYRPNVDAVAWFAHNAFPAIRRRHERAQFWIVGANPVDSVLRLSASPGVRVTGSVPDIGPYLAHAACVVAPLRVARGIQNKVLEAMAMAKPVVATLDALGGLSVVAGREVLMAANGAEFVRCVTDVLAGHYAEIGEAARRRVEMDYRWSEKLKVLDCLFPRPNRSQLIRQANQTHSVSSR